jgi:hypothetical protein
VAERLAVDFVAGSLVEAERHARSVADALRARDRGEPDQQ